MSKSENQFVLITVIDLFNSEPPHKSLWDRNNQYIYWSTADNRIAQISANLGIDYIIVRPSYMFSLNHLNLLRLVGFERLMNGKISYSEAKTKHDLYKTFGRSKIRKMNLASLVSRRSK